MNILIESMTKFTHKIAPWKEYYIRCWRGEQDYYPDRSKQSQADSLAVIEKMPKEAATGPKADKYEIAKAILSVDRMNAVEVIDETGGGVILYADWP